MSVPWARKGGRFALLFEQGALLLVREMPVLAAARIDGDHRPRRCGTSSCAMSARRSSACDLARVTAIGLDEPRPSGHAYVTVFIDLDRTDKPVVSRRPGRGKDTVAKFKAVLARHGGSTRSHRRGRVCDIEWFRS